MAVDIDGATEGAGAREVAMYLVMIPMPSGKAVAQGAHAALGAYETAVAAGGGEALESWRGMQTKIALRAPSGESLVKLREKLAQRGVPCCLVRDAGLTVFREPTITALGVGPVLRSDVPELRKFQVYRAARPDLGLPPDIAGLVAAAYRDDPEEAARRMLAHAGLGGDADEAVKGRLLTLFTALARQLQAERAGA